MRLILILLLSAGFLSAQKNGRVERVKVHGRGLEGNLSGDSPDRDVSIYLPSGYQPKGVKRYPVIYLLHGFTDDDARWFGLQKHWIHLPNVLDKAGTQAIVVMPNAFTRFQGSMYSNSVTTGNWEDFVARELVAYVDSHYRTLPTAASRGLAGHSMGGYGTLRIGMKYPEVFSAIYALSPCCLINDPSPRLNPKVGDMKAVADLEKADFGTKAVFASAAAWSPNPSKPPFFVDLPFENGELQPMVVARWTANAPLALVDQSIPNLKRLKAIAFDAGDQDVRIAATVKTLDAMLTNYQVPHFSEIYSGNHIDHVAERIELKVVPFFAKALATAARAVE